MNLNFKKAVLTTMLEPNRPNQQVSNLTVGIIDAWALSSSHAIFHEQRPHVWGGRHFATNR